MRRRTIVLSALGCLLAGAAITAKLFVWRPLPVRAFATMPELAAPLRTPAEHDALYGRSPYVIEVEVGVGRDAGGTRGRALVLGMRHTDSVEDPQIAELRARFSTFKPTLVLVEGRLGWHIGGRAGLLSRFGESGEAVALADLTGVPCGSLEPDPAAEVADAVAAFGRERTLAFYFLRVFTSERDSGAWPREDMDAEALALLQKRGRKTGLGDALPDLAAFDRFWREQGPAAGGVDWRELPAQALWRNAGDAWTHRIAERVNAFRDRAFVYAITDAVLRGERVLAVCGSSHAILFEPALRAAISRAR